MHDTVVHVCLSMLHQLSCIWLLWARTELLYTYLAYNEPDSTFGSFSMTRLLLQGFLKFPYYQVPH